MKGKMNDNSMIESIVDKIHESPHKAVVIATGGGSVFFDWLLHRGGGSNTLLSGRIPYSENETCEILGGKPDKISSDETARLLAMAAFQQALKYCTDGSPVFGIGATSSLQKTPTEREGRIHRIHVAYQSAIRTVSHSLIIDTVNPIRTLGFGAEFHRPALAIRMDEELVNARMILNLVAYGCSLEMKVPLFESIFDIELVVRHAEFPGDAPLLSDIRGETQERVAVNVGREVTPNYNEDIPKLILTGSFNPMHEAHLHMMNVAEGQSGIKCEFEISIRNVDKPSVDFISLAERFDSIKKLIIGERRMWITNAPRFVEKSNVFPGATFVIGYDTALRIVDPKYAGNVDAVLDLFEKNRTGFIVFGRIVNGTYMSGYKYLPRRFARMCAFIDKHMELSSSEIRKDKKDDE
jgi:hypothetical protein